jgi:Ni/Co efflux regulator RcnB
MLKGMKRILSILIIVGFVLSITAAAVSAGSDDHREKRGDDHREKRGDDHREKRGDDHREKRE